MALKYHTYSILEILHWKRLVSCLEIYGGEKNCKSIITLRREFSRKPHLLVWHLDPVSLTCSVETRRSRAETIRDWMDLLCSLENLASFSSDLVLAAFLKSSFHKLYWFQADVTQNNVGINCGRKCLEKTLSSWQWKQDLIERTQTFIGH